MYVVQQCCWPKLKPVERCIERERDVMRCDAVLCCAPPEIRSDDEEKEPVVIGKAKNALGKCEIQ